MTYIFECPSDGEIFERELTQEANLLSQPCDACPGPDENGKYPCGVRAGTMKNRKFEATGVTVPKPDFKGGYEPALDRTFDSPKERDRYMDQNHLREVKE